MRVTLAAAIFSVAGAGASRAESAAPSTVRAVVSRPPQPAERATGERPLVGTPMDWPKNGLARVVWTGFQMNGDGSRVFLQATRNVEVTATPTKDGLTVTVHACRLAVRNGGRPMDTRFFQTPVKSITLHQRKNDVVLSVALKDPVDVVPRKESGPNGSQFWVLDFPSSKSLLADGARPPGAQP